MNQGPLVSIIINNYNYDQYLKEAIDSALNQTYPHVEVIVVDDGSTDNSREVIASYGDRIVAILKENRGQASAVNVGYVASKGEVICWLDSDDLFHPEKVERTVKFLLNGNRLKRDIMVCHPIELIKQDGTPSTDPVPLRLWPKRGVNYLPWAYKYRYIPYSSSLPSGVAVTRSLAQRVFPLPEGFPSGADNFLIRAAGMLGNVYTIGTPLAKYRVHGSNNWYSNQRPKSKEFRAMEEAYLNKKLAEIGHNPSISFFKCWDAKDYYSYYGCTTELWKLGLAVFLYHPDIRTLRWSTEIFYQAAKSSFRRLRSVVTGLSK
jgi:glycosyltransferase involved in cell wall biosynthesis